MSDKKAKSGYYFKTLARPGHAEFKDRGSNFIAYAFPIETQPAFKQRLKSLKEEHPKAAHFCYAFRLGITEIEQRSSDDGEPSGSAGRPILGQLESKQIQNSAIIVVRYFGGTLLGVPGLIQAYKTAASMALQVTPIIEQPVEKAMIIQCSYPLLNEVMTLLKQHDIEKWTVKQALFCTIETKVALQRYDEVAQKLSDIFGVEILTP